MFYLASQNRVYLLSAMRYNESWKLWKVSREMQHCSESGSNAYYLQIGEYILQYKNYIDIVNIILHKKQWER